MIAHFDWNSWMMAQNDASFGKKAWLTFYLAGNPEKLCSCFSELGDLGATNLEGAECGMVYAKFPVLMSESEIAKVIDSVLKIATNGDLECDIIDLDSSDDVEVSKFYTVWAAT